MPAKALLPFAWNANENNTAKFHIKETYLSCYSKEKILNSTKITCLNQRTPNCCPPPQAKILISLKFAPNLGNFTLFCIILASYILMFNS